MIYYPRKILHRQSVLIAMARRWHLIIWLHPYIYCNRNQSFLRSLVIITRFDKNHYYYKLKKHDEFIIKNIFELRKFLLHRNESEQQILLLMMNNKIHPPLLAIRFRRRFRFVAICCKENKLGLTQTSLFFSSHLLPLNMVL